MTPNRGGCRKRLELQQKHHLFRKNLTGFKKMILSIHIPKCGGQSFSEYLRKNLGDRYVEDYGILARPLDRTKSSPTKQLIRKTLRGLPFGAELLRMRDKMGEASRITKLTDGVKCIHGHFPVSKYIDQFPDATLVTWVRDPAERLLSEYNYFMSSPESAPKWFNYKMNFRDFMGLEETRNEMSGYLNRKYPEGFAFIGITEHYDECLKYFADKFFSGYPLPPGGAPRLNTGRKKEPLSEELRNLAKEYHPRDYEIYQAGLVFYEGQIAEGKSEEIPSLPIA